MKTVTTLCLFALLAISGCDNAFVTSIDIKGTNFSPRLAVSATLDTDGGVFTMSIYQAVSIPAYSSRWDDMTILKPGTAKLYKNDEEIWSFTGKFDLSNNKDWNYDAVGNEYPPYFDISLPNITAGSTFRLEIAIDGYDPVTSTAVMPADPLISDVMMDEQHSVTMHNIYHLGSDSYYYSTPEQYFPVRFNMKDNTPQQDYYALRIYNNVQSLNSDYPFPTTIGDAITGTANVALIQDNPEHEAESSVFGDDGAYDLYVFGTMLISDITFGGGNAAIELFTPNSADVPGRAIYKERPEYYSEERWGPEVMLSGTESLTVKHISSEAFRHYRAMVLQDNGMDFFSEPVLLPSNITGGYGCFSLQNTARFTLREYTAYWYPKQGWFPPDGEWPVYE